LAGVEVLERDVDLLVGLDGESPPGGLGEALLSLGRVVDRLSALRALWAEQFEAGSEWAADGARSGSSWVAARSVEHPGSARSRVHAGRDLRALPLMRESVLSGEVRLGHVRLLAAAARAKEHRWAALPEVEADAVRWARQLTEPKFARYVEKWAALVDAQHDEELRAQGLEVPVIDHADADRAECSELFLSRFGVEGMWALSGTLDPETGLALSVALESVCEAIRSDERDRSLAELRHDALGVLLNGELSAGLPVHKGVRPHVMLVVRASDDGDGAVNLAMPAPAEVVDRSDGAAGSLWVSGLGRQRLSCDAVVATVVLDAAGVPLRMGRSVRVVPPALRRLIDVRDRHCKFAGCTAPAVWCQAHHLVHWEDGGPTDERNLALACSYHHRAIHERGFALRWDPGGTRIETVRPDESVIEVPARR
jgi:hypothetical protein